MTNQERAYIMNQVENASVEPSAYGIKRYVC